MAQSNEAGLPGSSKNYRVHPGRRFGNADLLKDYVFKESASE